MKRDRISCANPCRDSAIEDRIVNEEAGATKARTRAGEIRDIGFGKSEIGLKLRKHVEVVFDAGGLSHRLFGRELACCEAREDRIELS